MMSMSQETGKDFLEKVGYDDDDERNSTEVPKMRPRMDTAEAGTASPMPELQADTVGHPVAVVSATKGHVYFVETEDGQFVKIGFSKNVRIRMCQIAPLRPGSFALRPIGSM